MTNFRNLETFYYNNNEIEYISRPGRRWLDEIEDIFDERNIYNES